MVLFNYVVEDQTKYCPVIRLMNNETQCVEKGRGRGALWGNTRLFRGYVSSNVEETGFQQPSLRHSPPETTERNTQTVWSIQKRSVTTVLYLQIATNF